MVQIRQGKLACVTPRYSGVVRERDKSGPFSVCEEPSLPVERVEGMLGIVACNRNLPLRTVFGQALHRLRSSSWTTHPTRSSTQTRWGQRVCIDLRDPRVSQPRLSAGSPLKRSPCGFREFFPIIPRRSLYPASQPGFTVIFRRADDQRDYDLERLNNAVTFVTEAKQLCFEFPEAFRIPIFQLLLKWPFGDC